MESATDVDQDDMRVSEDGPGRQQDEVEECENPLFRRRLMEFGCDLFSRGQVPEAFESIYSEVRNYAAKESIGARYCEEETLQKEPTSTDKLSRRQRKRSRADGIGHGGPSQSGAQKKSKCTDESPMASSSHESCKCDYESGRGHFKESTIDDEDGKVGSGSLKVDMFSGSRRKKSRGNSHKESKRGRSRHRKEKNSRQYPYPGRHFPDPTATVLPSLGGCDLDNSRRSSSGHQGIPYSTAELKHSDKVCGSDESEVYLKSDPK